MKTPHDQPDQAVPQPTQAAQETSTSNTVAHTDSEASSAPVLDHSEEEVDACVICLGPFDISAKIVPCSHHFHFNCIMAWFSRKAEMECPCCTSKVKEIHYISEDGTARIRAWIYSGNGSYRFSDNTTEAHQLAMKRATLHQETEVRVKREMETRVGKEIQEGLTFQRLQLWRQSNQPDGGRLSPRPRVNLDVMDGFYGSRLVPTTSTSTTL